MVKIEPVDINDIPEAGKAAHRGSRGRVSGPILQMFLDSKNEETGKPVYCAKLDRTGLRRSLIGLRTGLQGYIRKHDMPIKLFQKNRELYMMRTDIDEEGNPIAEMPVDSEDKIPEGTVKLTPEKVKEMMS